MIRVEDLPFDFNRGSCNSFLDPFAKIMLCFDFFDANICHTWVIVLILKINMILKWSFEKYWLFQWFLFKIWTYIKLWWANLWKNVKFEILPRQYVRTWNLSRKSFHNWLWSLEAWLLFKRCYENWIIWHENIDVVSWSRFSIQQVNLFFL